MPCLQFAATVQTSNPVPGFAASTSNPHVRSNAPDADQAGRGPRAAIAAASAVAILRRRTLDDTADIDASLDGGDRTWNAGDVRPLPRLPRGVQCLEPSRQGAVLARAGRACIVACVSAEQHPPTI